MDSLGNAIGSMFAKMQNRLQVVVDLEDASQGLPPANRSMLVAKTKIGECLNKYYTIHHDIISYYARNYHIMK